MASVLDNYKARYMFEYYLQYREQTESPPLFHRWALACSIGAVLRRNFFLQFGDMQIFPNQYVMFLGSPGTRKSTAIKMVRKHLVAAGFDHIAADKTSKEKFLLDLAGEDASLEGLSEDDVLNAVMTGGVQDPACVAVMADEFNDFVGLGNLEFLSLLGSLWDYSGVYKQRLKNSKSIEVQDPTVTILSGNTPAGFSLAFPPEAGGQGILSRLILVHGEDTGKRIAFPPTPDSFDTQLIQGMLDVVSLRCMGPCNVTQEAKIKLEHIYLTWKALEDPRLSTYSTRRFTHLLKICLVCVAARSVVDLDSVVELTEEDVLYANSMLTYTEKDMSNALGEYGRSKTSPVAQTILETLASHTLPLTSRDILKCVNRDLQKPTELQDILSSLLTTGKIQQVDFDNAKGEQCKGFALIRRHTKSKVDGMYDFKLLWEEQ